MWLKPSKSYVPLRGDILRVRLFDDKSEYKVEVTQSCGKGVWYVYEDISFRNDFKVDISLIECVQVDKEFYERRIKFEQKKIDVSMKRIVQLKAEMAHVVDIESI